MQDIPPRPFVALCRAFVSYSKTTLCHERSGGISMQQGFLPRLGLVRKQLQGLELLPAPLQRMRVKGLLLSEQVLLHAQAGLFEDCFLRKRVYFLPRGNTAAYKHIVHCNRGLCAFAYPVLYTFGIYYRGILVWIECSKQFNIPSAFCGIARIRHKYAKRWVILPSDSL